MAPRKTSRLKRMTGGMVRTAPPATSQRDDRSLDPGKGFKGMAPPAVKEHYAGDKPKESGGHKPHYGMAPPVKKYPGADNTVLRRKQVKKARTSGGNKPKPAKRPSGKVPRGPSRPVYK